MVGKQRTTASTFAAGTAVTVEELDQRLHRDEEWLKDFQRALGKSNTLTNSVCSLLDRFQERIDSLSTNVATLYAKSSVIQREQQGIRKLLSTVDATIQFHGKTTALENTICDGNVLLALDDYLEKMRTLKEAIAFFSTHSTYKGQLEHIKHIYEIGCTNIESEFGNLVKFSCIAVDPVKLFDCLDDDYEMPSFRMSSFLTLRDTQKIHQMAAWLLEHTECTQYLQFYVQCRAENMLKPIRTIGDQIAPNNRAKSAQFVKTALKKAAGRIADSNDQVHRDNAIAVVLFQLSTLLVLIQLETDQCANIFSANVRIQADVLRQIVSTCLGRCLSLALRVVEGYEAGSFPVLLPLARFLIRHANQLAALSENVGESAQFASLQTGLFRKSVQLIQEYRDRLAQDQIGGRFVPEDGNVHPISSGTMNLLKVLVQQQKLLTQLIQQADCPESAAKLTAQILLALGQNLRHKSGAYADPALGSLFLFNNLHYVGETVERDKHLLALIQQNSSPFASNKVNEKSKTASVKPLAAQFKAEAETHLQRFLESWARIGALFRNGVAGNSDGKLMSTIPEMEPGDERKAARTILTNFTRDFDALVEQQKNYCLADQTQAARVRLRIKELVLNPFVTFSKRHSHECAELFESDRQLKYDAETVEIIIDRLFDATL